MRITESKLRKLIRELMLTPQMKIPHYRQQTIWSCGPASAREILLYFDIDISEKELIKKMNADPDDGTEPQSIVKYLNSVPGISAESKQMTIRDLIDCARTKCPVIVNIQAWTDNPNTDYAHDYNDGHYVVLTGYQEGKFMFADPATYDKVYLTTQQLKDRWHDIAGDGPVKNLGIVVRKSNKDD